jgi:hypothetical protein
VAKQNKQNVKQLTNDINQSFDSAILNYTRYLHNTLKKSAKDNLTLRNKFFLNSIQYKQNKKKSGVEYEVGVLDRVDFIDLLTEGGVKNAANKYIAIPNRLALGVSKNKVIPRSKKPNALLKRKNIFMFFPKNKLPYIGQVYSSSSVSKKTGKLNRRMGKNSSIADHKVMPLYWLKKRAKYKGNKFPFEKIVDKFFTKNKLDKFILNELAK